MHYAGSYLPPLILPGPEHASGFTRLRRWWADRRPDRDAHVCANAGGPMHRQRAQDLHSSLLGDTRLRINLPYAGGYGITSGRFDTPLERAWHLLEKAGYSHPEEAALASIDLPAERLHVQPAPPSTASRRDIRQVRGDPQVLRAALILGRCTSKLYDPERPVIWTANRLERWVNLYHCGSFYHEDD